MSRCGSRTGFQPASLLLLFLACCLLITPRVDAFAVKLPFESQECFFEKLQPGDSFLIAYQVGEGGQLDIDFFVTDPNNAIIVDDKIKSVGTHTIQATVAGTYNYCFRNYVGSREAKLVTFNVHNRAKLDATVDTDPLEIEIRQLGLVIESISDEQEYLVIREQSHRDTAESTNSRVVWWSLTETAILVSICLFQIWYIRRFFEVKRVV